MVSIPVYLRLWRLYASNQHLLKMYYFLYYDVRGNDAVFYKRVFSKRIIRREQINKEIEDCIKAIRPLRDGSMFSKLITSGLLAIFSIDYNLQKAFNTVDLDKCHYFEIKNVELYYELIFAAAMNEEIIDMLLDQKSVIEETVFSEI